MAKNNHLVMMLLLSGLLFIGLSIAAAVSIVSTPAIVQVVAPVSPISTGAMNADGTMPGTTSDDPSLLINSHINSLLAIAQDSNQAVERRDEAIQSLSKLPGGELEKGKLAFKQHCSVCHKIQGEGADFAPDLTEVASRLTREKIIESIVHPSAVLEEKYKTSVILTLDGEVISGLLVEKSDSLVKMFDGKITHAIDPEDIEEIATKSQSSMPEKLADALAPGDFLALVEYLAGMKKAGE